MNKKEKSTVNKKEFEEELTHVINISGSFYIPLEIRIAEKLGINKGTKVFVRIQKWSD